MGFGDHFEPEFEGEVFALRIAEVDAEFVVVAALQGLDIERHDLGEVEDVVAVTGRVAFDLGKSDVVGIEGEETEPFETFGEYLCEPVLVVFGQRGDADGVEIDPVLSMEG